MWKNIKIDWKVHIIDLIVVIVGVTIAFALTNYQEVSKEKDLQKTYLQSLANDLEVDVKNLEEQLDTSRTFKQHTDGLARAIFSQNLENDSVILQGVISLYVHIPFNPHNATYKSLIGSGQLDLIRDIELRKEVIDVYETHYKNLIQLDDFMREQSFNNKVPYFQEKLVYKRGGIANKEALYENKFINLIFSTQYFWEEKINTYQQTLESAEELLQKINKKLDEI
jgi:hypothetical protein